METHPIPRRHLILAATAATLGLASNAKADIEPAETAKGTVYEQTASGRKPIPGILVSNGEDVEVTAQDGTWSLPISDGESLFVIKPTGWMTPVDPITQLPNFAYVHRPKGTQAVLQTRFAGLAPTGPLPPGIDFELRRRQEPTKFDALLLTDPQPESTAELGYVRDDVIARLSEIPVAFGIAHGDIMFDDLAFYDRYNRAAGTAGFPWHACPGNHDMNYEAPDNALSRETFKRIYGARHHAFQYGGVTFFVLDNVEYLGADETRPTGAGRYRGRFGSQQLAFVRNVLAHVDPQSLVVVSHHIPLHTLANAEPANQNTDTADLLAALSTHRNCVSFSGHTHTNEHWYLAPDGTPADNGHHHHVLSAVSGSWWSGRADTRGIPDALATDGSPNGFHILSIDGTAATTRLIPAHEPTRSLLRIVLDSQMHTDRPEILHEYPPGALLTGPISAAQAASTRVVVNFFEGGPTSSVNMSVGSGPSTPMQRVTRIDPFVQEAYARDPATTKPWVKPEPSSHLWQASLPATLPPGTHRLAISALDEHCRPHHATLILEIVAA